MPADFFPGESPPTDRYTRSVDPLTRAARAGELGPEAVLTQLDAAGNDVKP
jgi:hypothetical protein